MVKFVKGALLTGILGIALGGVALAQPLTDAEFKCQGKVSKAGSKFVGSKAKCAIKCQQNAQKGLIPDNTGCYGPSYTDPATNACVLDPLKGAEAKFALAIKKSCDPVTKPGADCPECYSGGDCSDSGEAGDRVQNVEGQVDDFGPSVFCLATPTKEELGCETNTAKTLSKHVGALNKCYDKCESNARKGLVTPASCDPFATTDPLTTACRQKAETKAIAGVNKKCGDLGAIAVPDCDGDTTDDYPDGSAWTNLVTVAITGNIPGTYCDSPSSAFLD